MARVTELQQAFSKLVSKLNELSAKGGTLASLSTTDKSSLVAAINEVKGIADAAAGGGVSINDSVTNTVNAWSSTKIDSAITSAISAALEGEDLSDLADAIAALVVTDAGLVNAKAVQSFTDPEKVQARDNIDAAGSVAVGDTDHDFESEIDGLLSF